MIFSNTFFLAELYGLRDFSSPDQELNHGHDRESTESSPLSHQRIPPKDNTLNKKCKLTYSKAWKEPHKF